MKNNLSHKVIFSKLTGGEKITVPIGSSEKENPLFFILVGLLLSVCTALLINSKKRFREEVTRSLLKPYNFFADIRDHRILSGVHSNMLMVLIVMSFSLLLISILHYLKGSILFEKILLSFGKTGIVDFFGYLSWNPEISFFYLSIIIAIFVLLIVIVALAFSFFSNRQVRFANIYFTVIWAFLPFTLLIPLELVLYRILSEEFLNLYIFIFLVIFTLWLIQRLVKGIYVVFDVKKSVVYIYASSFFIIVFGGILFYFQITESTIFYALNAIKQYMLL